MELQAKSVSDMKTHMSVKEIYNSLEVEMPYEVKYCPYTGSYEQMIHKAINDKNIKVVKSLIEYRDAMIKREKNLEELYKNYPEQLSQVSGATVN